MWKPWILIAVGSIVAVNVASRGLAPQSAIVAAEQTSVTNSDNFWSSICSEEIERACGASAVTTVQGLKRVVIDKKGTFRGTGNEK